VRIEQLGDSYAVCADCTLHATMSAVEELTGLVPLVLTDPPYGKILPAGWDHEIERDDDFVRWMLNWTMTWSWLLLPNAAFYVWGGIGRPGFRPFFKYIPQVEDELGMLLANLITWKKKRAYGVKHNYLFTREELAYFINGDDIKKPRCFNIPLLEEKRGYAGYNAKYPAKSEFYRRTNVWTDVTEVMQKKVHEAQKAQRVIEVPIEVHTQPGEFVIDPFAGSGTTGLACQKLGRRFVCIEKDEATFDLMVNRLSVNVGSAVVVSDHEQRNAEEPCSRNDDDEHQDADHR